MSVGFLSSADDSRIFLIFEVVVDPVLLAQTGSSKRLGVSFLLLRILLLIAKPFFLELFKTR